MTLIQKLVSVYEEIDHIQKSGHNKNQNYDFVRAADMVRAVRKALLKLGVYAEVNLFSERQYTIAREKAPNAPFNAVDVRCTMVFHDGESGETLTASGLGTGADTGDKAIYKAQTGSVKYCLRSAFLVPDEADPEADESVDEGYSRGGRPEEPVYYDDPQPVNVPDFSPPPVRAPRPVNPPQVTPPPIASNKAVIPDWTPAALLTQPPVQVELPLGAATAPVGPVSAGSKVMPTNEEMDGFRQRFVALANELTLKGKLAPSAGLKINDKIRTFLLQSEGAEDTKKLTKAEWDDFFARTDAAIARENGIVNLAKLVNDANGIQAKTSRKKKTTQEVENNVGQ